MFECSVEISFSPLIFSEERAFLWVDSDCFLTFRDLNWQLLPHGLWWKLSLGPRAGPTCKLVAPETLLRSETKSNEWLAQVDSCPLLCKGVELWVVRNTATGFSPPGSGHWAGRSGLWGREGADCSLWHELHLDIGPLACRNSVV